MAERVAQTARRILGDARVVLFGSVVRGDWAGASDVDVLIVSDGVPLGARQRAELKRAIEEGAGLPPIHPVEIHLVTKREAKTNSIYAEASQQALTI